MIRPILLTLSVLTFLRCSDRQAGAPADGQTLFKKNCVFCHGIRGDLQTNGARDLRYSVLSMEERMLVIGQGRNLMTGFEDRLTPEEIRKVAEYTLTLRGETR